jgi:ABC-type polysaccharide/polyol phosphate export permease
MVRQETVVALTSLSSQRQTLALGMRDLLAGLRDWEAWYVLASNDIRQRYRRSGLGQLWLTLSMAATIGGIGFVWAFLFNVPLADYLPYVAIGMTMWMFISGLANDLTTVFVQSEAYLRNVRMPLSTFIYRVVFRNLIILAHNIIVPIIVLMFFWPKDITAVVLIVPGLVLLILHTVWVGLILGALGARFRDLPLIIASLLQIVFFLTPILWKPSQLPAHLNWLTEVNPFHWLLNILRAPLLGEVPPIHEYALTIGLLVVGYAVAVLFFSRFRARIVYWL